MRQWVAAEVAVRTAEAEEAAQDPVEVVAAERKALASRELIEWVQFFNEKASKNDGRLYEGGPAIEEVRNDLVEKAAKSVDWQIIRSAALSINSACYLAETRKEEAIHATMDELDRWFTWIERQGDANDGHVYKGGPTVRDAKFELAQISTGNKWIEVRNAGFKLQRAYFAAEDAEFLIRCQRAAKEHKAWDELMGLQAGLDRVHSAQIEATQSAYDRTKATWATSEAIRLGEKRRC